MTSNQSAVVAAVLAGQQPTASHQQRVQAVQLFEQLKSGDVHSTASLAVELSQPTQPLEAQVLGYSLLQHLVGNRWEDISAHDQSNVASLAYNLLRQSSGNSYAIRSKSALLLALVIKRSGAQFMKTSLSQLVQQAMSSVDPGLQEATCLVIKHVADEIVHLPADDLQGELLRTMVKALTEVLPPILNFLERTIEINFAAVSGANGGEPSASGPVASAAAHAAAIGAALDVAEAHAEWAPVAMIKDSGLINAAGFLLSRTDHRDAACRVLLQLARRKQSGDDDKENFPAAMQQIAEALLRASEALLSPPDAVKELDYEGEQDEFGQEVCEAMAALGTGHFVHSFPEPGRRLKYLQNMLAFAQHPYLLLADKALTLWAKLLQDDAAAVKAAAAGSKSGQGTGTGLENPAATSTSTSTTAPVEPPLPPEGVLALMQLAAEQLQQRNPHVPQQDDEIPPYFDAFEDYKEFMIGYRSKLSSIVKSAAAVLPQQALAAASERLNTAIAAAAEAEAGGNASSLPQARVLLESAVVFVDSTCKAVWDAALAAGPAATEPVIAATEPMLQSLLALRTSDAQLLQSQARGLEAFPKLIGARPQLAPALISCLFELLVGSVPMEPGGHLAPPSKPPPGWRDALLARATVAGVFLVHARVVPEVFLPHLEAIAGKLTELYQAQQLRPGERNVVCEGLLAASLAGPEPLQASLAEWALAPVREVWATADFRASLASPAAFLAHFVPSPGPPQFQATVPVEIPNGPSRWRLYHQVHLIERAVRRMQGAGTPAAAGSSSPAGSHPLTTHMSWAIPPLLQLCSCLNAVYSPGGREALGPAAPALELSFQECAMYLRAGPTGRRNARPSAAVAAIAASTDPHQSSSAALSSSSHSSGDYQTVGGSSLGSLRGWLRHLREYCFQTLGLLPVSVPPALDLPGLAPAVAPSVCAYVETLDHRHVRTVLRHMLIPYIKTMPARHLEHWVVPSIAAIAPHMQGRLATAWQGLTSVDVGGGESTENSVAANMEIIRECQVRELTLEYADALREMAARTLEDPVAGPGPHGTPLGAASAPVKQGKAAIATGTLLQLLLERQPGAGIAIAQAAVEGMQLPDEAAYRFAMFCRALVALAPKDARIYAYAGLEVLKAAITSLASDIMSKHQADILGLIRAVLAQQLENPSSNVHVVLRSLPGVDQEREAAFARSLLSTASEKEQRNAVKKFLVEACGRGSFAALADWRPPTANTAAVAVVGSMRQRGGARGASGKGAGDGDAAAEEALQGDMTRYLFSS